MMRWILSLLLLVSLTACNDDDSGPTCPLPGGNGPALAADRAYVLVAGTLSEDWAALDLSGATAQPVGEHGLTGRAPNMLVVQGDRLLVVNSLDNAVQIVDLATGASVGCIPIGAGTNPWDLAIDPDDPDRAWLTTWVSGELVELNLASRRVVRRITVAPAVEGVLVAGDRVLVTATGYRVSSSDYGQGQVIAFDRATLAESARFDVPRNPQTLLEGPDGRIHVVCTGNYGYPFPAEYGRVVRIEPDLSAVRDTLAIGGAPARAVATPDGRVWLASITDGILVYDGDAFTAIHDAGAPILPASSISALAIHDGRVYAASFGDDSVVVLDAATESTLQVVLDGLGVDGPTALAVRAPLP